MHMQNNNGVLWGTIKFFMGCLESHKNYVVNYERTDDILFHLTVAKPQGLLGLESQSETVDVALAGGYVTSEAEVLSFHADFPTAKIIVLGGNWWKYTSEAEMAADKLGMRLMKLNEFLSALYFRKLV